MFRRHLLKSLLSRYVQVNGKLLGFCPFDFRISRCLIYTVEKIKCVWNIVFIKHICKCRNSLASYWWLPSFWLEIPCSHCHCAPYRWQWRTLFYIIHRTGSNGWWSVLTVCTSKSGIQTLDLLNIRWPTPLSIQNTLRKPKHCCQKTLYIQQFYNIIGLWLRYWFITFKPWQILTLLVVITLSVCRRNRGEVS